MGRPHPPTPAWWPFGSESSFQREPLFLWYFSRLMAHKTKGEGVFWISVVRLDVTSIRGMKCAAQSTFRESLIGLMMNYF